MSIDIKELSEKDLQQKIENIKAEREKTADALKRYEEELERRKKEVPLGVPLEDKTLYQFFASYGFYFESKESEQVFSRRIKDYVEALQKLAKGEPIDIRVLLPLLQKGWVTMSANRQWRWYSAKPFRDENGIYGVWSFFDGTSVQNLNAFNIKPSEDWTKSLQECGL